MTTRLPPEMASAGLHLIAPLVSRRHQVQDGYFRPDPRCYPSLRELSDGVRERINASVVFSIWPEAKEGSSEYAIGCMPHRAPPRPTVPHHVLLGCPTFGLSHHACKRSAWRLSPCKVRHAARGGLPRQPDAGRPRHGPDDSRVPQADVGAVHRAALRARGRERLLA